jgi:ribose/xylose/arabinose/galactoside ABC-type transport system permease subunit
MTYMNRTALVVRWIGSNSALTALLVLLGVGGLFVPYFLTKENLAAILSQYTIIGFLALGQLLVILTGGIDLSQGSMVALTSILVASLMQSFGVPISIIGGLLGVALLGLFNGFLVARTKIPPFVVTLGMLGIARGLALLISDAKPIAVTEKAFVAIGRSNLAGVPLSTFLLLIAVVILALFLKHRKYGRHIYAVGGGEESARLSGVDVRKVKLLVYALSGFLTAIGGIMWTARLTSGSPIGATGYEMESIAAVIVGGGSFFGGNGTVVGTTIGVLLFGQINSVLNLIGISPYWQGTIKGVLILMAVALSQLRLGSSSSDRQG